MARKKRLTREEKKELSSNGKCWKCQSRLQKLGNILKCEGCGIQIVPSEI